jgi:hypothetical protein
MDQSALVTEQVEAGAKFLDEFQKSYPVQAAFWLYGGEDGRWRLYIASEKITDDNFDTAYGKAARVARKIDDPWLDPFVVKLIRTDDRLAKAAVEVQRRYPRSGPAHFPGRLFGPGVEPVCLYPQPAATP